MRSPIIKSERMCSIMIFSFILNTIIINYNVVFHCQISRRKEKRGFMLRTSKWLQEFQRASQKKIVSEKEYLEKQKEELRLMFCAEKQGCNRTLEPVLQPEQLQEFLKWRNAQLDSKPCRTKLMPCKHTRCSLSNQSDSIHHDSSWNSCGSKKKNLSATYQSCKPLF